MRSQIIRSLATITLATCALPLGAETVTFKVDPAATTIAFRFGATLHAVQGSIRARGGEIRVDPETGQASGRIVIDGTTAETGNQRRDEKMHEKILETARFPEMVFTLERISGDLDRTGRSDVLLHGTLAMHGVERPLDLLTTTEVRGDLVTATATTTIPYLEWGIDDPSFFVLRVDKEVHLEITTSGRLRAAAAAVEAPANR